MANYSDNTKPFHNIQNLLPEVYRSDVNKSVFEMAFNRHLTKDDTKRVAGYIGEGNSNASVNRQIQEDTPHRQAFQLAPTMVTSLGTERTALSFEAFQRQLALMGVDIDRIDDWGSTLQFNWVPPINLDMLINYQDYFWTSTNTKDSPQYLTIENRCNKVMSRLQSYTGVLNQYGDTFDVIRIENGDNAFVISGKYDDLYTAGFVFFTKDSSDVNLDNLFWTVDSSSYDEETNETIVVVIEPINPSSAAPVTISLQELLQQYTAEANCVCNQVAGWDAGPWDFTPSDQWDFSDDCIPQQTNQWVEQNRWMHKTQVQSFANVKRAQLPILEYSSAAELNQWAKVTYAWKYRHDVDAVFTASDVSPSRLELEPIKDYVFSGGYLYLFTRDSTQSRDADLTSIFKPGFRFRVANDTASSQIYTVATSEYRETLSTDPVDTQGYFVTIVTLVEPFTSSLTGAGGQHVRIEPVVTSHGDFWKGYHAHWVLDESATVVVPTSSQPLNIYLRDSLLSPGVATVPPVGFVPAVSSIVSGPAHQQFTVDVAGVTHVDLLDQFKYNPAAATVYATPNSNELRVYVNNVRQYSGFSEVVATAVPNYTVVGHSVYTTQRFQYVTAIVFDQPLELLDVVRIEVGPAAMEDMGYQSIAVRTIENEADFIAACAGSAPTQPAYRTLTKFKRIEQTKSQINQYPLFNMYNVVTSEVIGASQLFGFQEDSSASINTAIQRRIVGSTQEKNFAFQQYLLDRDDNFLYGYRNTTTVLNYWYSPLLNKVQYWDGFGWTDQIVRTSNGGRVLRTVQIAAEQPATFMTIDQSFWFDTKTNRLFVNNAGVRTQLTSIVVSGTDPSLQTIWRHGSNNEQYVPEYVDANKNVIAVGDPAGSWEVVDQWKNNAEHQNKAVVTYAQLLTHFRSILESQPRIPGMLSGGVYTLMQSEYNYGLGGTIKEHNDSFDTLISAVNVTNATPVSVLDFAAQEYATALLSVRDLFTKLLPSLMTDTSPESLSGLSTVISNQVIDRYENNDSAGQLYGDTSAYDAATRTGVRNWIATAPMFGLAPVYRPHLSKLPDGYQLFHHDGHRSTIQYTPGELDRIARIVCNTPDSRVSNGKYGKISSAATPSTTSALITQFGSLRTGVYWYRLGATHRLYRFEAYAITPVAPALTLNGQELPDGTGYYDTTLNAAFVKSGMAWVQQTATGSFDLSPLWKAIDFSLLLGEMQLTIEQRLFDVTPSNIYPVFDYDTLTTTPADRALYARLREERFNQYISSQDISGALLSSYRAVDPFTWNYVASTMSITPYGTVYNPTTHPAPAGSWQEAYTRWYGTPYPHLEPWKLQGYADKPTWWDEEYKATSGRRWIYNHATTTGMWENIRIGFVPLGRTYPDGTVASGSNVQTLRTYAYFSVNISNNTISGGYGADDLLPPYYPAGSGSIRSLYTSGEVVAEDADYVFGDGGPVEWQWNVSIFQPYDRSAVAFQMQPMRFMHATFGPRYTLVDGLQVETTFNQVYSHEDALFHGDIYNTNKLYTARGLNQWYVNFNRYTGYDTNGEFRELWAGWNPQLTYQFGGIVDTSTFEIANKYYDVINQDYSFLLANNGVVSDVWVDAFDVKLIAVPPPIIQYNNQAAWKLELDTLAAIPRSISYYGVRSYPIAATVSTNTFTAFRYAVASATPAYSRFTVSGDQTYVFTSGSTLVVSGSSGNDGTYTVVDSAFDVSSNKTRIAVEEPVPSGTATGFIDAVGMELPWETGQIVALNSTRFLPSPIYPDTPYFFIRLSSNTFQLAESADDAFNGVEIDVTSVGSGDITVAEVEASFQVFGGQANTTELWYHYKLDKDVVRTFSPPMTVVGMQTLINIIDGYAAYQRDHNIAYGTPDSNDFDPVTNRLIDWSLETERFIDWAYGIRSSRLNLSDSYPITVDPSLDIVTFTGSAPLWRSGTAVGISTTGSMPTPLIANTPYYVVTTGVEGEIRLSTSANAADTSSYVDLIDQGSGSLMISVFARQRAFPRFEMNPSRNNIWINTPTGVLSNVIAGPYSDIRVQQTIFDQYNRPLSADKLTVYREDKRSRIAIRSELKNDVDNYVDDPYNYLHIGGAHLFVEGYEHFLVFNNYTSGGSLIYDPFLGIQTRRFDVDFNEKADYSLRPTLGGFYLLDQQFNRNLEGSAEDLQNFYDVMALSENTEVARRSRALIGYTGRSRFLDLLNINNKSQFLFYRGMIQTKGSVNSVKAFVNSRRFFDASVDEYWAWKIADYGDMRPRIYPEIKLFSTDGARDDVRLEFLAKSDLETDDDIVEAVNKGFQLVSFKDDTRWNIFPEQKEEVKTPLFLDTEVSKLINILATEAPPTQTSTNQVDYWYQPSLAKLWKYDTTTGQWSEDVSEGKVLLMPTGPSGSPAVYFNHGILSDDIRVLRRNLTTRTYAVHPSSAGTTLVLVGDARSDLLAGNSFYVQGAVGQAAGTFYTTVSVTYNGTNTSVVVEQTISGTGGFAVIQDFNNYTTEILNPGTGVLEYTKVDTHTVRFNTSAFSGLVMVFVLNPSKSRLNPAKLIDNKSKTVVQQIPLWDPIRGYHSTVAAHNIDLIRDGDPAYQRYQFTSNPSDASLNFWNEPEVGTVWMDTAHLGYLPYNDDRVYPDVNDRLYNWGKLAQWGDVRVFQWIRSSVPPSQWDDLVTEQALDSTIPQNEKATGTPRKSVFKRVRSTYAATFNASTDRVSTSTAIFADGDELIVHGTTLPTGVEPSTKYIVGGVSGTSFQLIDPNTEQVVTFTDNGTGCMVTPAFTASDWVNQVLMRETVRAPFMLNNVFDYLSTPVTAGEYPRTLPASRLVWTPANPADWIREAEQGGVVDVYINGLQVDTALPVQRVSSTDTFYVETSAPYTLNEYDAIDIIRTVHVVTADDLSFDPDVVDDGTGLVQWKEDYEYSSVSVISGGTNTASVTTTNFYFWVEAATVRSGKENSLSVFEIAQQIREIPTPYFVVQKPKDDPYLLEKYGYGMIEYGSVFSLGSLSEQFYQIPVQYREAIIRKVASYLNDDDRYTIRFTRDLTLRDNLDANGRQVNLKNQHQEWFLFRRGQTSTIPQELWTRLTEALIGHKLTDATIRVPSLERELYDAMYGTDTRFGLGTDQAFVDKNLGLGTILAYLQDPTRDFAPINIDSFLTTYSFDTPENIAIAMDAIYNSFSATHVNAMWFDTLMDAFSTRAKYKELMKTSWVALRGVRVLEVNGVFDD